MIVINTRLRFIASKDPTKLVEYCNSLPYKIEIKGNPVFNSKKFYLFFILPDTIDKEEIVWGDIDQGGKK
jgi:hypothetical protein